MEADSVVTTYVVSTAKNGPGQRVNSECTPTGKHQICAKFGKNSPVNTVFVGRKATGEIYSPALAEQHPQRDWILSRIMWLEGLEPGHNVGDHVDTKARFIYIHGTPDDVILGQPGSRGCIRMVNDDVLQLYDFVDINTQVLITD